jgi:preprotein translocase subunit SecF
MDDTKKEEIEVVLRQKFGDFIELSFGNVSATIGGEVVLRAAQTVLIAALGIMLYLWFAFRQVPHAFRYGVAAIIAMLHDVLVTVGMAALFGKLFGWQVDSLYLTALLTVIGFSVHDTIVVFDRVRENLIRMRGERFDKVVNFSILQTLNRSINTQLTVVFTLVALILFGGVTIRHFVTIMLIGLLSGTYSSIFNASQILVVWENKEWRTWFRRKPKASQATA